MLVKNALAEFYTVNEFDADGGASKALGWVKFGFISVPIPNTAERKANIFLHDLSHIVTGYDTTWRGESCVSAWEVASGGWGRLYFLWFLTLWGLGLGVLRYPKAVRAAFAKGQTMRNGYIVQGNRAELVEMEVSSLQALFGNQPPNNRSQFAWFALGVAVFIAPFLLGAAAFCWILNNMY
jgi:hypothetical protein